MASTLVINEREYETRVAVLENNDLVELYIERNSDSMSVGNIYKGPVTKVLPGMDSAFIDIGQDRAAFLSVSDIYRVSDDVEFERKKNQNISSILKKGNVLLVQISKGPIGTKGPRVTTNITLPGRYLVLTPMMPGIGISRKIEQRSERDKLKKILEGLYGIHGYGLIARTASEGVPAKVLKKDYDFLVGKWNEMVKKKKKQTHKGLVHTEMEVSLRVIRDVLTSDVNKIVVDNQDTHRDLVKYLGQYDPRSKRLVEFYGGEGNIFEKYDVERKIAMLLEKKVWLKSGGYIVIDQAEAAVVIDVNTGKYVGNKNFAETIFNTNLEAVKDIAYQLRLRNLGGVIIIDFIDMDKKDHREKVIAALKDALKKDRAKTNVIGMSELGFVEMTRKRVRDSFVKNVCSVCPYCAGRGYNKSYKTVTYEVFRDLEKHSSNNDIKKIVVCLNPVIIDYIYQNEKKLLEHAKKQCKKEVVLEADKTLHHEQYKLSLIN